MKKQNRKTSSPFQRLRRPKDHPLSRIRKEQERDRKDDWAHRELVHRFW